MSTQWTGVETARQWQDFTLAVFKVAVFTTTKACMFALILHVIITSVVHGTSKHCESLESQDGMGREQNGLTWRQRGDKIKVFRLAVFTYLKNAKTVSIDCR